MGTSHSLACNNVVKQICEFAVSKDLRLSATHFTGRLNIGADAESKKK